MTHKGYSVDLQYWRERWKNNQIGFHKPHINTLLTRYITHLRITPGQSVLVPLCGKTVDMMWLREQGFDVIGNDISERALQDFFSEQQLAYQITTQPHFQVYQGERIQLYCGDFFQLQPSAFDIHTVYDRASLIALPTEQRPAYAQALLDLTPNRPDILLITLEYDTTRMQGPPFSVTQQEVASLFAHEYQITRLQSDDIIEEEPHFKQKGLSSLTESVYLLNSKR